MIVENEPYLIEYNVRMGDPEYQTILPKLKNDIVDVFLACCENNLDKIELEWSNKKVYVSWYALKDTLKLSQKMY